MIVRMRVYDESPMNPPRWVSARLVEDFEDGKILVQRLDTHQYCLAHIRPGF